MNNDFVVVNRRRGGGEREQLIGARKGYEMIDGGGVHSGWRIAAIVVGVVSVGFLIWAIVTSVLLAQSDDLLPVPEIPDIAGFEYEEVFRKGPGDGSFFFPVTTIRGARMPGTNYMSLFVGQQNGWVWKLDNEDNEVLWLDLSADTLVNGEGGFNAIEFHPRFGNGDNRFWVRYTEQNPTGPGYTPGGVVGMRQSQFRLTEDGEFLADNKYIDRSLLNLGWEDRANTLAFSNRIAEYTVNGNNEPVYVKTIMRQSQPATYHAAYNSLKWDDASGKLLIAFGDGSETHGQNGLAQGNGELCGHAFLLDVNALPASIPTPVASRVSELPTIVQNALTPILKGFRNPTGFAHDPENDIYYLGLCGQEGTEAITAHADFSEERNLGWPWFEAGDMTRLVTPVPHIDDPDLIYEPEAVFAVQSVYFQQDAGKEFQGIGNLFTSGQPPYDVTAPAVILDGADDHGCAIVKNVTGRIAVISEFACSTTVSSANILAAGGVGVLYWIDTVDFLENFALGDPNLPGMILMGKRAPVSNIINYVNADPTNNLVRIKGRDSRWEEYTYSLDNAKTIEDHVYQPVFKGYHRFDGRPSFSSARGNVCWTSPVFYRGTEMPSLKNNVIWGDFQNRPNGVGVTNEPLTIFYGTANPNDVQQLRSQKFAFPVGSDLPALRSTTGTRGPTGEVYVSETNVDTADTIVYKLKETTGSKRNIIENNTKKATKMSPELLEQCKERMQAWGAMPKYETN